MDESIQQNRTDIKSKQQKWMQNKNIIRDESFGSTLTPMPLGQTYGFFLLSNQSYFIGLGEAYTHSQSLAVTSTESVGKTGLMPNTNFFLVLSQITLTIVTKLETYISID